MQVGQQWGQEIERQALQQLQQGPDAPPEEAPQPAQPVEAIDAAFRADILKMLQLTGASQSPDQTLQTILNQVKQLAPDAPDEFWERLAQDIDVSVLMERLVPVYAGFLSHDDIKAIIAFHESTAGQHFIAAQPQIMAESMQLGMRWGQKLAQEVGKRLQQRRQAGQ